MKFVVFDEWRVGLLDGEGIREVSRVIPEPWRGSRRAMNWVVENFDGMRPELERLAAEGDPIPPAGVRLRPPVPVPMQLLAAPANNAAHAREMTPAGGQVHASPREVGFFLKAPGSITGPNDTIVLPPLNGRRFDHEAELAFVIGRPTRHVSRTHALDCVFGYTCLIDVTLRAGGGHNEERPMRKSYATFSPVGPALVTADEMPSPDAIRCKLWVNGDLRQDATTADLIVGVAELLEQASHVLTLEPGDLYTTGSPAGVGPIVAGDLVEVEMDQVGRMRLPVVGAEA